MDGEACSASGDLLCKPLGISCRFARVVLSRIDGAADAALTWGAPPTHLMPLDLHVDVWLAELDSCVDLEPRLAADLTPQERARAERFRFSTDRRRFVARRAWLRRLLAAYLDTTPSNLLIAASPLGKPFVKRPTAPQVSFSLSHSSGWALAAVTSTRDLGVDVEALAPCPESEFWPTRWLSDEAPRDLATLPPQHRASAFLKGWTCVEALSKAAGVGLDVCAHRLGLSKEEWPRDDSFAKRNWRILRFVPHADIVAALVVEKVT